MSDYLIDSRVINFKEMFEGTKEDAYIPENSSLIIPSNQRSYEWDKENINDFITDLSETYLSDENYFMGNIILNFYYDNNIFTFEIQDGQQRITTVVLYFAALSKFLNQIKSYYTIDKFNDDEDFRKYHSSIDELLKYCNSVLYVRKTGNYKLESGIFKNFLQELIDYSVSADEKFEYRSTTTAHKYLLVSILYSNDSDTRGLATKYKDSTKKLKYVEKNILNAYLQFYETFYNSWKDSNVISNKNIFNPNLGLDLETFTKYLYSKVLFNILKLDEPFTKKRFKIFETINARGKRLKEADKIKNHILAKLYYTDPDLVDEGLELWSKIVLNTDTYIEEFVKDMVLIENRSIKSNFGVFSTKQTFQKFEDFTRSQNHRIDFLKLLKRWARYSSYYDEIINPEVPVNLGINYYNARQILKNEFVVSRFFQLQVYDAIPENKFRSAILKDLVSLYILSIVLETNTKLKSASRTQNLLIKLCSLHGIFSIYQVEMKAIKMVIEDFYKALKNTENLKQNEEYLTETTLRKQLKQLDYSKQADIVKYILVTYENSMRTQKITFRINNETTHHLEHICPVNPDPGTEEWNFSQSKNFTSIVNSLGNYLILRAEINLECSNKTISEKLKIYSRDSEIKLVNDFINYSNIHQFEAKSISNDIKSRTDYLAKAIAKSKIFDSEIIKVL